MCFHKSLLLWQLIWNDAPIDYKIKAHKDAQKKYFRCGIQLFCYWFGHARGLLTIFAYFWTNFGQMTLTFRVGRSRSSEVFSLNCCNVSSFDMNRFGPYVYRITTKIRDIIIGPMYSKAVTFDL